MASFKALIGAGVGLVIIAVLGVYLASVGTARVSVSAETTEIHESRFVPVSHPPPPPPPPPDSDLQVTGQYRFEIQEGDDLLLPLKIYVTNLAHEATLLLELNGGDQITVRPAGEQVVRLSGGRLLEQQFVVSPRSTGSKLLSLSATAYSGDLDIKNAPDEVLEKQRIDSFSALFYVTVKTSKVFGLSDKHFEAVKIVSEVIGVPGLILLVVPFLIRRGTDSKRGKNKTQRRR